MGREKPCRDGRDVSGFLVRGGSSDGPWRQLSDPFLPSKWHRGAPWGPKAHLGFF